MAATNGVRTWQRVSNNPSLPLDERLIETTSTSDLESAIREADFITIPRTQYSSSGKRIAQGYDETYASRLAEVLKEKFGYSGQIRSSRSGNSFVFERKSAAGGSSFDFGLHALAIPAHAMNGAQAS